jgi:maleylacetate reductase
MRKEGLKMFQNMPASFVYETLPGKVIFGVGSLNQVSDEITQLNANKVFVIATSSQRHVADRIIIDLGNKLAKMIVGVQEHVPASLVNHTCQLVLDAEADAIVTVGGGSAVGLAKAISVRLNLPIVVIPTTYSGSEATAVYGITDNKRKVTKRDIRALPKTVIYDPELTLAMPPELTASSGMNAIAHCIEAMYAKEANPITSILAEEGLRALTAGLRTVSKNPWDMNGRSSTLYGSYLAGLVFGTVGGSLHHKMCHILGGCYGLSHRGVHSVMLPYVTAFNASFVPESIQRIERALGIQGAAKGLTELAVKLGTPLSLKALGMTYDRLEEATTLVMNSKVYNPRTLNESSIRSLLEEAYWGNHQID